LKQYAINAEKMVSIKRFSKHERKELVINLLKKHPRGLTTKQIASITSVRYKNLTILKELADEKKIKIIKFGNANLYKVIQ